MKRLRILSACTVLALAVLTVPISAKAQVLARPGWAGSGVSVDAWWKHAVIYEIYPRSFQDSNGDGVGDLKGITQRLDYLQALGVDAIWLTPIYLSPQVDFGYDISNYEAIDPQYGTMEDFDDLVEQAGRHNIRVVMDMVLNHTSDQHPWFMESAGSRSNPKRDWYIWRDGRGCAGSDAAPDAKTDLQAPDKPDAKPASPCTPLPPNNWQSIFGHSAWKYDAKTSQWYFHQFYPEQPDLNWRNPAVEKAMFNSVHFWLNRGVAGFRLDAVPQLFEDPSLKDAQALPGTNAYGDPNLDDSPYTNLPDVHTVLHDLRKTVAAYPGDRVLIGETYLSSAKELAKMYGAKQDELQLPMDTQVGFINKLDVSAFRNRIQEAETQLNGNQPLFVFDNHDQVRSLDRYGDGTHNQAIARLLAAVLLTTRATALMYYGQEIGMATTPPASKEDVKDPIGILGWPQEKGRDGERTPMQWDSATNAGFTVGKPWLPIPPSAETVNVKTELADPGSTLNWYKHLIALRRSNHALRDGTNTMFDHDADDVLVWMRKANVGPAVVVACNFSSEPRTVSLKADLKKHQVRGFFLRTLLYSAKGMNPSMDLDAVKLPPFGVYIGEVHY